MCARIAIDIDDTLYSFRDAARQVLSELASTGIYARNPSLAQALYTPWTQWRTPHDILGDEIWNEVIAVVHDDEMILSRIPYDYAVETLLDLGAGGHEFVYISNRATSTAEATRQWLSNNGFPYGELVVMDGAKAQRMIDCQYLIDDRVSTLVQFVTDPYWEDAQRGFGRKAFALMKEYNWNLTDVPNIYLAPTWTGLSYYLRKKNLISNQRISA